MKNGSPKYYGRRDVRNNNLKMEKAEMSSCDKKEEIKIV